MSTTSNPNHPLAIDATHHCALSNGILRHENTNTDRDLCVSSATLKSDFEQTFPRSSSDPTILNATETFVRDFFKMWLVPFKSALWLVHFQLHRYYSCSLHIHQFFIMFVFFHIAIRFLSSAPSWFSVPRHAPVYSSSSSIAKSLLIYATAWSTAVIVGNWASSSTLFLLERILFIRGRLVDLLSTFYQGTLVYLLPRLLQQFSFLQGFVTILVYMSPVSRSRCCVSYYLFSIIIFVSAYAVCLPIHELCLSNKNLDQ